MSGGGCASSVHRGKDGKHTVQDVPQDVPQDDGKRQCLRASKYALIKKNDKEKSIADYFFNASAKWVCCTLSPKILSKC